MTGLISCGVEVHLLWILLHEILRHTDFPFWRALDFSIQSQWGIIQASGQPQLRRYAMRGQMLYA